VADLALSVVAVLLIGPVFVIAAGLLVWALPLDRLMDRIDEHDRHITRVAGFALLLLALLVAGTSTF